MIRQYSLINKKGEERRTYVFFGEIPNMPGHCIVMDYITGEFESGYHTENFVEIPEDET